ncbi:MAG: LysR family transcriptional regulator [Myxococcales bacterium]|nr:LysR family transcriptional regulator [Myxococcales bacterium]
MDATLRGMNLNLLVALDALLAERSVTRAARRTGVTQSAMSQSLAALRAMLGDPVLVRTPTGMQLTTRAEALGPPLRRCLDELGRVLAGGGEFDPAQERGTVRIATGEHLAALLAAPLLTRLAACAPDADLRIDTLDARRTTELLDGGVDLVIGPPVASTAVGSRPLFEDRFVCVLRRADVPTSARAQLPLRDYLRRGHVLISPSGQGSSVVDRALADRGHERRIVARVGSFMLAPQLVAQTGLILTAPRACVAAASATLPLAALRAPVPLPPLAIACHWDLRRGADPRVQWLRGLVEDAVRAVGLS